MNLVKLADLVDTLRRCFSVETKTDQIAMCLKSSAILSYLQICFLKKKKIDIKSDGFIPMDAIFRAFSWKQEVAG